ncbi:phosphoadenosine phosphosulfate reductase [Tropicimonas aquimaris]|uniref:Phosphoadenosine phosphosulfate reductase n=1 Tax=Tropicimonas aquimaris TaxID=914152 RepID=A0ABW3IMD2_9RHOB
MTQGTSNPQSLSSSARTDVQARLDRHGADHGYHRRLDARHGALFTEDDDILIVTFETLDSFRDGPAPHLPFGLGVAGREGWSHLCLYSDGETFFRSEAVYAFFDELVDEGFFDAFERVIFYGAGPCGYAAATYSVVAPGATAFLVRPLATLDPRLTPWDRRYPALRRTDFTDRYGYAPEMLEAAEEVVLLHDPHVAEDAMHATLFDRPDLMRLDCPWLGKTPEKDMLQMGVLLPLLRAAGKGTLEPSLYRELYQARFSHKPYLRRVERHIDTVNHPKLRARWARAAERQLAGQAQTAGAVNG